MKTPGLAKAVDRTTLLAAAEDLAQLEMWPDIEEALRAAAAEPKWYDDRANLLALVKSMGSDCDVTIVCDLLEDPESFEAQWQAYCARESEEALRLQALDERRSA